MGTQSSLLLGMTILLGADAARAADIPAPEAEPDARASGWDERGRLDLGGAFALHDHTTTAGGAGDRVRATGGALTHVAADAAWMLAQRPLGLAAGLGLARLELAPDDGGADGRPVTMTGLDARVGVLGRLGGPRAKVALEGLVGYGLVHTPILSPSAGAPMSLGRIDSLALLGHGPALEARLTLSLGGAAALEATGRALPLLLGARAAGESLDMRRYSAGAGARLSVLDRGVLRVSALVGYEIDVLEAKGDALESRQRQHRFGLGLRTTLVPPRPPERPTPVIAPATPPPVEVVTAAAPRVLGLVRAAPEGAAPAEPVDGASVILPDGRRLATDGEGRFSIEGLPPGLASIRFSSPGFDDRTEVVSVPAKGEVQLSIELRPSAAIAPAALMGQVRQDDGSPVRAEVRIVELGRSTRADEEGRFRFDVPPGRYTIVIEAPGFVPQRKSGPVTAGEHSIFNVDLQRQR